MMKVPERDTKQDGLKGRLVGSTEAVDWEGATNEGIFRVSCC